MITKLQNKLTYEAKQKELQSLVEKEAKNLQDVLDSTIKAKSELVAQVERKARLNKEIEELNKQICEAGENLRQTTERVTNYLSRATKELKEQRLELDKFRSEVQEEIKNLDSTKTVVTELYGKIATYARVAQETLKYVNQHFEETGTPINFGLLPDEIVNINIDNFTEKLNV